MKTSLKTLLLPVYALALSLTIVAFDNGKLLHLPFSPSNTKRNNNDQTPFLKDQSYCKSRISKQLPKSNMKSLDSNESDSDRRKFIQSFSTKFILSTVGASSILTQKEALAADLKLDDPPARPDLSSLLYTILRAREATTQESRLIQTGKFKDVQRANVKLAVKFMVQNYKLSDTFIQASTYLNGNKRYQAYESGQQCVQTLYTILEYFDSSDVQNLKVGAMSEMDGKEKLVLKGLEAARSRIDEFLSYFPGDEVNKVQLLIAEENALNAKEFDPALGAITNPDPKV